MTADALRDEAVAWVVRVQSDAATADDWAALRAWLEQSEAHLAAFEAAEAVSADIADFAAELAEAIGTPSGKVVSLAGRRRERAWLPLVGLAAAAAVAAVIAPVAWRGYQGAEVTYRTAPGATREVALSDGTRIRLDAASTMKARMGWRARRIELADGEASFDVAKDPGRPFLIHVGDQQVRVVGTRFNIRHYDGLFVLTVSRGVVEVRQDGRGDEPIARLTVGDELRHRDGSDQTVLAKVDPAGAFAWTEGRLVCDGRPLGEIVAYLNRRYGVAIRVSPEAAERRFSGVLELGDEATVLRTLGQYMQLPVRRSENGYTLG